ncbi:hypothetical protein EJ02DRAFT_466820 [Clathrospora elynae]|uniref:Uncharacterized protein n=1 Tax=Clathrospora elynae TaxID=706981 RepID=A0A6A5SKF4_9PLEO|nr:hypothetical protein EJ02DRAFT_466820 [Clathrospora elynae]
MADWPNSLLHVCCTNPEADCAGQAKDQRSPGCGSTLHQPMSIARYRLHSLSCSSSTRHDRRRRTRARRPEDRMSPVGKSEKPRRHKVPTQFTARVPLAILRQIAA